MNTALQTSNNSYNVSLNVFEGPLDLLLHLIKENQMNIYDIPISQITEKYLAHIELLKELNLEIAGEFLLMAATLAHIKSKMLLPQEQAQDEDGEDGPDPRDELVRRLLEYQKYKQAADDLLLRPLLGKDIFTRTQSPIAILPTNQRELAEISIFKLIEAFGSILKNYKDKDLVHRVDLEPVSIKECAQDIVDKIKSNTEGAIKFTHLFSKKSSRIRVVTTFLAVLSLIKRGVVRVFQNDLFSEIQLMGTPMLYTQEQDFKEEENEYTNPNTIE